MPSEITDVDKFVAIAPKQSTAQCKGSKAPLN